MVSLRDDLKEFREHNLEHKEPSPEKVGMYQLRMSILAMGKSDSKMINRMQYYVRLLSFFLKKSEKSPSLLLMELGLFRGLLNQCS